MTKCTHCDATVLSANRMEEPAPSLAEAVKNYFAVWDRCGGDESVDASEFAEARQNMRAALASPYFVKCTCPKCEFVWQKSVAATPVDVLERIAREQLSDPATDDLTVPLAIELSEMTTRALKAEAALAATHGEASWHGEV